MARIVKISRVVLPSVVQEIQVLIPSRDICDQLVQCYLRTFEGAFRVLHIPSFTREYEVYWSNPSTAAPSTPLKILLVCAIGVVFYTGTEQPRLRANCAKWLQAAESWLSTAHMKSRFNMAGTQVSILILIARQTCNVDGDLVWVPAGHLLRGAMHLGLHRDPSQVGKMSVFHAEMRRRLWATIMEITVQTSLDMGMPPMISPDDFDTLPPSNINDDDLDEPDNTPLQLKPLTEATQCSVQILFYETLPLRLEVCRLINSIRQSASYNTTLQLGSTLLAACRQKVALLQAFVNASATYAPNRFQLKLFDTLTRRFYLCLHRPFFLRAAHDPKYYFARKACLDSAIIIATPNSRPPSDEDDDWNRLAYRGTGFVRSFFLHSLSALYFELVLRLQTERDAPVLFCRPTSDTSSQSRLPPDLTQYYEILEFARFIAEQRLHSGDAQSKGYVWLCCALACVDALVSHKDPDAAVLIAAKRAVHRTAGIVREAYFAETGVQVDLSQGLHSEGKDLGSGDRAGDATSGQSRDGSMGGSIGAENASAEDRDWQILMSGGWLDLGWEMSESPDNWFGWEAQMQAWE